MQYLDYPETPQRPANILFDNPYRLKYYQSTSATSLINWCNHLPWDPYANDLKISFEGDTSDGDGPLLPPLSFPLSPLFIAISQSACICFFGTTWSMSPLSMSIGSVFGIRGTFEAEFHLWRHMNENIPIMGQSRTTPGSEVNVFSTMSAVTCVRGRMLVAFAFGYGIKPWKGFG